MAQSLDHYSTIVGVQGGGIELNSAAGNGPDMVLQMFKIGVFQVLFLLSVWLLVPLLIFVFLAAFWSGVRMLAGVKNIEQIKLQRAIKEMDKDYLKNLGLSEDILIDKIRSAFN